MQAGGIRQPFPSRPYGPGTASGGRPASASTGYRGARTEFGRLDRSRLEQAFAALQAQVGGVLDGPYELAGAIGGVVRPGVSWVRVQAAGRAIAARHDLSVVTREDRSTAGRYFIGFTSQVISYGMTPPYDSESEGEHSWEFQAGDFTMRYEGTTAGLALLTVAAGLMAMREARTWSR